MTQIVRLACREVVNAANLNVSARRFMFPKRLAMPQILQTIVENLETRPLVWKWLGWHGKDGLKCDQQDRYVLSCE